MCQLVCKDQKYRACLVRANGAQKLWLKFLNITIIHLYALARVENHQ